MQNYISKILLFPFSVLYGIVIGLRNMFYDAGLLKATKFNLPIINVGNLTIGGAGKTPHIEYLIELLQDYVNLSTLSRGYKRKTKGFRIVRYNDNVSAVGDEPLQYKRKYKNVEVAVAESRNIGIPQLIQANPKIQTILLDDAFQHRSVDAGLNILLTEFNLPYYDDYLLPAGRLRERSSASKRANIIIVTKCPEEVDEKQKLDIKSRLNLNENQRLFYSKYEYLNPYHIKDGSKINIEERDFSIILISAIASTDYLLSTLESTYKEVINMQYEDHHYFSSLDLQQLKLTYDQIENPNKLILTTEKDGMRLSMHLDYIVHNSLPVYILPIKVAFLDNDGSIFDALIQKFLLDFKH